MLLHVDMGLAAPRLSQLFRYKLEDLTCKMSDAAEPDTEDAPRVDDLGGDNGASFQLLELVLLIKAELRPP